MNLYKDKHIFIPLFLVFAAIVSYRAWQDMHPPPRAPHAFFDTYYFVHNDAMLTPFTTDPEDKRLLVIEAGDIRAGKDGALALGAPPVTPISLPQREIVLVMSVDAVPKDFASLGNLLAEAAGKWRDLGDIINDIYIKGPTDKKSLAEMVDGMNTMRDTMHNDYWLGIFAEEAALKAIPDARSKLEEAGKSLRTVILNAKNEQHPDEKIADLIMRLDKSRETPFLLQVEALPDYNALQKALTSPGPDKFVGFLVDADKAPKPPQ